MKSSKAASFFQKLCIVVLIFTNRCLTDTASLISDVQETPGDVKNQEYCVNIRGRFVIGLKPYITSSENPEKDCRYFWYCRKINGSLELPVKATKFDCAKADSSKPFYDASKCECVSTSDHCHNNNNVKYSSCVSAFPLTNLQCTTEYDPAVDALESCRAFGKDDKYFSEKFVHYDDPAKYWECVPKDGIRTEAQIMDCNNDSTWDSTVCSCKDNPSSAIHETNIHPMNRYKCAVPYAVPRASDLKFQDNPEA